MHQSTNGPESVIHSVEPPRPPEEEEGERRIRGRIEQGYQDADHAVFVQFDDQRVGEAQVPTVAREDGGDLAHQIPLGEPLSGEGVGFGGGGGAGSVGNSGRGRGRGGEVGAGVGEGGAGTEEEAAAEGEGSDLGGGSGVVVGREGRAGKEGRG